MPLLNERKGTVTVVGNTGFFTIFCSSGFLKILSIVADDPSYVFNMTVTNNLSTVIDSLQSNEGEFLANDLNLPLRGNATISLTNADNGTYEVFYSVDESR